MIMNNINYSMLMGYIIWHVWCNTQSMSKVVSYRKTNKAKQETTNGSLFFNTPPACRNHLTVHLRTWLKSWAYEANLKCRGCVVPRETQQKIKSNSPRVARRRIFSRCARLDCQIKPFSTVYDILASFSDLTDPSINFCGKQIILTSSSFPGDRPANFRISFVSSHLTAKISITI